MSVTQLQKKARPAPPVEVGSAGPDTAEAAAAASLPASAAHGLSVPAGPVFGPDAGVVGSAESDRVSTT
jgi:hypothetical protein